MVMAVKTNSVLEKKNCEETRYGIKINELGNFYVVDLKKNELPSSFKDTDKISKSRR